MYGFSRGSPFTKEGPMQSLLMKAGVVQPSLSENRFTLDFARSHRYLLNRMVCCSLIVTAVELEVLLHSIATFVNLCGVCSCAHAGEKKERAGL